MLQIVLLVLGYSKIKNCFVCKRKVTVVSNYYIYILAGSLRVQIDVNVINKNRKKPQNKLKVEKSMSKLLV